MSTFKLYKLTSEGGCVDYLYQDLPQRDRRRAELSQKQNALEVITFTLSPQLTSTNKHKHFKCSLSAICNEVYF